MIGTVQKEGTGLKIQVRLFNVRRRQAVFAREYTGSAGNPRAYAHTMADEIHQQQRALRGVARTKLTFSSDRDGERVTNTVENRDVKEVYIADYDGANQRRITVNRALNITPTWSPDGRSIAYTSYARGFPTLFISFIYEGRRDEPTRGSDAELAAGVVARRHEDRVHVEPRRQRRAVRDEPRRLRPAPPDEPPGHRHDADLVADRRADRLHVRPVGVAGDLRDGRRRAEPAPRIARQDGYCDRPTWSPAPFNELAFVCRTGPGYDIKIFDFATGETRQITFGEGSNESPAYSPNGRHLAFTSTRAGKMQVFTVGRDGKGLRQVTKAGQQLHAGLVALSRVGRVDQVDQVEQVGPIEQLVV